MKYKTIRYVLGVFALILLNIGCSDNSTGNKNHEEQATVSGYFDNFSSDTTFVDEDQLGGVTITAAKINAQGKLETIDDAQATTDAEGKFSLNINASAIGDAGNRMAIIARRDDKMAKSLVFPKVKVAETAKVAAIDFLHSAKLEVFQQAVAKGDTDIINKADVRDAFFTRIAKEIENDSSLASNMEVALKAKIEAKSSAYDMLGVSITDEQKSKIAENEKDALLTFILNEYDNTELGNEQGHEYYLAYAQAIGKAETDAGISPTAVTKSSEIASAVLLNKSYEFSDVAREELRGSALERLTFPLNLAIQANLEAAGATQSTIDAASDSITALHHQLDDMNEASEALIDIALSDFNSSMKMLISNDENLKGEQYAEANASIIGDTGAKASLNHNLQGAANAEDIIDAYSQFYADTKSTVQETFPSASDAQIQTYTQLLIFSNIMTGDGKQIVQGGCLRCEYY